MSLRWRIALALAAIAAVAVSTAAAGAYVTTSRQIRAELDQSLLAIDERINAPEPGDGGRRGGLFPGDSGRPGVGGRDPRSGSRGAEDVGNGGPDVGASFGGVDPLNPLAPLEPFNRECPTAEVQPSAAAQWVRPTGDVVACYENGLVLPVDDVDLALARTGGGSRLRTVQLNDRPYRMVSVGWHHGGIIQAARGLSEGRQVLEGLRWRLGALVAAAVFGAAAAGWFFAGRIVRPLERLRAAAQRIARTGDLTTPVPASGPGEVGSLAASFTAMMGNLATSREQQSRLVADASHELRTPLTSLRTNVELLQRADNLPSDQRHELLADVRLELHELTELVSELVELATDRSVPTDAFEPVRLADVAASVVARARRRSDRPLTLTVLHRPTPDRTNRHDSGGHDSGGSADQPPVMGVASALERAVWNLVLNAMKYSDTEIEVVVDGYRIEVLDRGPGFADVDLPHVFERFYRSGAARNSPGSGLGLAIVQQIVSHHGGSVWAANRAGGGASVGFELPR
ncbi:MAG: ATP-binding protein [Acidimicrobiales bacterium]